MPDDPTLTGGTQPGDTARDPNLPRPADDTVRGAQEQDDSTKATAGVQFPGGTKVEVSTDGDQSGVQVTIPFGSGSTKPVDTTPSVVNPDAPADTGSCVGEDGKTYPSGWVYIKDMVEIATCVNGFWIPKEPPAPPPDYNDLPAGDPTTMVASNDPYGSPGSDPYDGQGTGDPYGDPNTSSDPYS